MNTSGGVVNNYSEVMKSGSVFQCSGCEGSTPAEIKAIQEQKNAQFQAQMQTFNQNMANQMANLGQQIERQVQENLRHAFANFPKFW